MLLIGKGTVITGDPDQPVIRDGGVVTQRGMILKTGDFELLHREFPWSEVIDARGMVIMPALTDTDAQIFRTFDRGFRCSGTDAQSVCRFQADEMDRSCLRMSAAAAYLEYIKNGVTTVFDCHENGSKFTEESIRTIAEVAVALGARTAAGCRMSGSDKKDCLLEMDSFMRFVEDRQSWNDTRIRGMCALDTADEITDETLHCCHSLAERGAGIRLFGTQQLERLDRGGLINEKTVISARGNIEQKDMELIAERKAAVTVSPEEGMLNADQKGNLLASRLISAGILTGLSAGHGCYDMFEAYRRASALYEYATGMRTADADWLPTMLFRGNARIAQRFFNISAGILKEGAAADIIVAEYDPFTPFTEENMYSQLAAGVSGHMVQTVVCSGVVLMQDRKIQTAEEAETLAHCRKEAEKLAGRVKEAVQKSS